MGQEYITISGNFPNGNPNFLDYKKSYLCKDQTLFDTNCFYDFLSWLGVDFKSLVGSQNNEHVNYTELNKEFESLLRTGKFEFSALSIFEVISHFRTNNKILYQVFKHLQGLKRKFNLKAFNIKVNSPFFNLGEKVNQGIYLDLITPSNFPIYVNEVVSRKMNSEAELLSIFVYLASISYILARYGLETKYAEALSLFDAEMVKTNNYELLKNSLKQEILVALKDAYSKNNEEKLFRAIFEQELSYCVTTLLAQIDLINDRINNHETPSFTFINQQTIKNRKMIENICLWFQRDPAGKQNLSLFEREFDSLLSGKGYSKVQQVYMDQMFESIFFSKAKIDKNDSEDFIYLGFIQDGDRLLTFDKQMLRAIKLGDQTNYDYLKRFLDPYFLSSL